MAEIHISNTLDWQNLIAMLRAKYEIDDLIVKYIDDENDEVSINSQIELENAIGVSQFSGYKLKLIIRKASTNETIEKLALAIDQEKPKQLNESFFFNLDSIPTKKMNKDVFCNIIDDNLISFAYNNNNCNNIKQSMNCSDDGEPPIWFTEGLKQMKSEILSEIEERMKGMLLELRETTIGNNSIELETQRLFNELERLYVSDGDERVKISQMYEKLDLINVYNAAFIGDANIPDGTKCQANMKFKKAWNIKNTGRLIWPENCIELVNVSGDIKWFNNRVFVKSANLNEIIEIEVELLTPNTPGLYYSEWVLMRQGYKFGPKVWCQIQVIEPAPTVTNTDEQQLVIKTSEVKEVQTFADFDDISAIGSRPSSLNTTQNTISVISTPLNTERIDNYEYETILPLTKLNKSFSITDIDDNSDIESASDDENSEFVVIPDCLDLNKQWIPKEDYLTKSCLLLSTTSKNKELIDSTTEPLLPKRTGEEEEKDSEPNLMIFSNQTINSTSTISEPNDEQFDLVTSTPVLENSNLITFNETTTQQQQQQQTAAITSEPTTPTNTSETIVESFAAAASATNTNSTKVTPSAPPMSPNKIKILTKQPTTLMEKLVNMGFCNRSLNKRLLDKYHDNIGQVIEHLVNKEDNDWASNRH